jgi:hypothetical protein
MTHPQLEALQRRIEELETIIATIPSRERAKGAGAAYNELIVGAGNVIGTFDGEEYKGLKYVSVPVAEVPAQAPTALTDVTADNLTAATLDGKLVWLASKTSAGVDERLSALEGARVLSFVSVKLPITGGGGDHATVYLIGNI